VAGDDRVAGDVVDDQLLPFCFRGLISLLLVISLAQQLLSSWPESSGTKTAFCGGFAELREIRLVSAARFRVAAWDGRRRVREVDLRLIYGQRRGCSDGPEESETERVGSAALFVYWTESSA
jgi:hypothetical protein